MQLVAVVEFVAKMMPRDVVSRDRIVMKSLWVRKMLVVVVAVVAVAVGKCLVVEFGNPNQYCDRSSPPKRWNQFEQKKRGEH